MWSKIIDPRISRRWLLRTCTGCKLADNKLNRGLLFRSRPIHGPPSTASSRVTDVNVGHSTRGGGGGHGVGVTADA